MLEITTATEDETLALGRLLGELVRPGDVLGLSGQLGAGKTVLTRGLAEGLGCDPEKVRSPTFTLMVTYEGGRLPLNHLDLYRLEATEDDRLALREVLFASGVSAIEWFERLGEEMDHLEVRMSMEASPPSGGDSPAYARRIRLRACGDGYAPLVEAVRSRWR
jgi:tRNA threonylcarbamoyladenosine biosynthesis protein TsaE